MVIRRAYEKKLFPLVMVYVDTAGADDFHRFLAVSRPG